jgi:hypothetical protein
MNDGNNVLPLGRKHKHNVLPVGQTREHPRITRSRRRHPHALIPVLVTGIQSAQVLGLKELSRRADARRLDPCDKHRDEGEVGASPKPRLTTLAMNDGNNVLPLGRKHKHNVLPVGQTQEHDVTRSPPTPHPHSLIPVLVTGTQSAQVLGLREPFRRANARRLDPCDKHRDEGEVGVSPQPRLTTLTMNDGNNVLPLGRKHENNVLPVGQTQEHDVTRSPPTPHPHALIPVLVTGIQPAQVLGLKELFRRADARRLDPCDKHRDQERFVSTLTPSASGKPLQPHALRLRHPPQALTSHPRAKHIQRVELH